MIYRLSIFLSLFVCLFALVLVPLPGLMYLLAGVPAVAGWAALALVVVWGYLSGNLALAFSTLLIDGGKR